MKRFSTSRTGGFTVIELMIVVIIIAILVTLAYPSYINYLRKAKRGEAQQLLLNWAINQEIFRSNNPTYADEAGLEFPTHDDYTFGFVDDADPDATSYDLEATATGDQSNDKARNGDRCDVLWLSEDGIKSPPACWE